jgi:hypothetical protein
MTFSDGSGDRTIAGTSAGVATSITAFAGQAKRGPVNEPIRVQSFIEFECSFGGLWSDSTLGYAVAHFFQNGGTDALIVRICGAGAATARGTVGGLPLRAASVGSWGNSLEVTIDLPAAGGDGFNLSIKDKATGANEIFRNLSMDVNAAGFLTKVLEQGSSLVGADATEVPAAMPVSGTQILSGGADGSNISDNDISGPALESQTQGLWALDKADLFNLLCIPPLIPAGEIGRQSREAAANYCKTRRALFIVDPPASWASSGAAVSGVDSFMTKTPNAAVFFPRLRASDSLKGGATADFAPCGAVAGVMARTDATRRVWQAPAGIQATIEGVAGLSVGLTDADNDKLNPLGVNCLRSFPTTGCVVWGARTLSGDAQYKYISVRRLSLFIEQSLTRGTQWAVFEPNAEPLWAQIRTNAGAFLFSLFKQQAFQGLTPQEAYFVKCDGTTMTQSDIDRGIVNIVVGIAPVRPAEFVIISISQTAGQTIS